MKDIYKLARKHKKLGFRPNSMHISILHIGKIYMNAKFLSEMSVYDSKMAKKPKFKTNENIFCLVYMLHTSLFLDSRRTWTFLMDLEMVSDGREHPSKVPLKVSSRSDIRNHVKTPPVLQVSSWSLGGHAHS